MIRATEKVCLVALYLLFQRSLPSVVDGLKPSQRKVLFTMFEHFERGEVRVSQLAGAVSQYCDYHHGEVCFYGTFQSNFFCSVDVLIFHTVFFVLDTFFGTERFFDAFHFCALFAKPNIEGNFG